MAAKLSRPFLMKLHTLLAAFLLPVAVMFFVTGGFYTWGVKGGFEEEKVSIKKMLAPDISHNGLLAFVGKELSKRELALPTGQPNYSENKQAASLNWGGSNINVYFEINKSTLSAELEIYDASWYRQLVQLHKAKGGLGFKIYAAFLAVSLLLILLSGYLMAWQVPQYKKLANQALGLGFVLFIGMVLLN